jgi:hypothetical protein
MDVLSASSSDNKIALYENDGNEIFTADTITTNALGSSSVYAVDVDGDLDMDVLSASTNDNKIAWYENDGFENFTTHTITTNTLGARSVFAVDVDGDGDMDVLSASFDDSKIAWYENLLIVGIGDEQFETPHSFNLDQNYPNPFNPSTKIKFTVTKSPLPGGDGRGGLVTLKVYDVLGKEVATLVNEEKSAGTYEVEWTAAALPSGVYFYQLKTEGYVKTKKMILLK